MEQWIGIAGTLAATVVGGVLVIFANWLTERRKDRNEALDLEGRNAALMTALFVVRNFLVESLQEVDGTKQSFRSVLGGLQAAQRNLDSIVAKSPPEVQYIMAAVFGISIRLGDLVSGIDRRASPQVLMRRHDLLLTALEEFDIYAGQDLTFLSNEDLKSIVTNPEDVPDD